MKYDVTVVADAVNCRVGSSKNRIKISGSTLAPKLSRIDLHYACEIIACIGNIVITEQKSNKYSK